MDAAAPLPWQSAPSKRASIGRQSKLGYLLAVLAFLGSAWTAIQSAHTATIKGEEASAIFEFLASLRETFSLVQDLEAGQRGYVITRQPEYLATYNRTVAEVPGALQELRERNETRRDQQPWIENFETWVRAKEAELSLTIRLIGEGDDDHALAIINEGQGQRLMSDIRESVANRQQQDLARLRAARDSVVTALTRAAVTGAGAAMLGIGILAASFRRIRSDSAARQALADAVFQQREELQVTLFSIGDGVITTDAQGRIKSLNGMAEQLTGWTSQQAAGQPLAKVFDIINEQTRESVENLALRALREGRIVGLANHTILIARDGTERAIDDSAAPVRSADGELLGTVLVFRDVTKQRRAEASLLEGQRRKDDFLAMLGHELRNPLAGILNGVQVLRMLQPQGDAAKMQEVIERQAAHMSRMVDDLLDISRFARGKLALRSEQLDLRELLRVVVEDYRNSQLVEDCELAAEMPDREVWVFGDRTRLAQAVSNLIHNGCKFCDGPNQVTVALQIDGASNSAMITVRDRGIGMDAATLATVFQPFVQADTSIERSRGGLGLGLALVQGLVRLHNGQVEVGSDGLGCGSQFSIRLPLSSKPTAVDSLPVETAGRRHRVLIIDDRRDAIMPLEKMLQMNGHQVLSATNGAAGLEAAQKFRPNIVLCDIGLADGMNGYDVARAIRGDSALAGVYLVAVTGYGQDDDRQSARAAGFDYHLTKPVGKQELDVVIGRMPRF